MEPSLKFQLLFAIGILPTVLSGLRQYHLIQDLKNWTDAQTFCRLNFDDLATVENSTDMMNLMTKAKKYNFATEAWIGLYNDINSWRWSLNDTPLGSFQNWAKAEPDNRNGHEECALIGQDGLWRDITCAYKQNCFCYNEPSVGPAKFIPVTDITRTWQEAQTYCRQHYTDLACPANNAENTEIQAKEAASTSWFGLFRDSWKWSDKTNVSTINWNSKQPDNAGGHDNCAFLDSNVFGGMLSGVGDLFSWLSGGSSGGWFDDDNCSVQRAFFCQSVPAQRNKQLLRVVVQSKQAANDPAVMATILAKIQQELQKHGFAESTSLSWREQPDGTVFYKKKLVENTTINMCEV